MRRLRVNMVELAAAFEDTTCELHFYLDLDTGQVELVTDEMRHELEDIEAAEEAEGELSSDELASAEDEASLPDWQQDALAVARAVEDGYGTRYIAIPCMESHEAYRDMEDFIGTVTNPRLQDQLYRAINGRGAFRYFKDVLQDHPRERERWFAYRDERMRQRALDWLEQEEIELIEE